MGQVSLVLYWTLPKRTCRFLAEALDDAVAERDDWLDWEGVTTPRRLGVPFAVPGYDMISSWRYV